MEPTHDPAIAELLSFFDFAHLRERTPHLAAASEPFHEAAHAVVGGQDCVVNGRLIGHPGREGEEARRKVLQARSLFAGGDTLAGLRRLLEAKDCAVRAALVRHREDLGAVARAAIADGDKGIAALGEAASSLGVDVGAPKMFTAAFCRWWHEQTGEHYGPGLHTEAPPEMHAASEAYEGGRRSTFAVLPAADRASDAWDPEVALTVALGGVASERWPGEHEGRGEDGQPDGRGGRGGHTTREQAIADMVAMGMTRERAESILGAAGLQSNAYPEPASFGGRIFLETDSGSRDLIGEVSTPFPVTAETIRATFADGEGGQIGTIKHWLSVHEIGPDGEVDDRVCIPEAWRDQARALLEKGSILVLVEATAFDPAKMRVMGDSAENPHSRG